MLLGTEKSAMGLRGVVAISGMRLFGRVEMAQEDILSLVSAHGAKFAAFKCRYALQSSRARAACRSVILLLGLGGLAKVLPSIVRLVQVFVIDGVLRPFAGHVSPNDAVLFDLDIVDADRSIAGGCEATGALSRPTGIPFFRLGLIGSPRADSGNGIVRNGFAHSRGTDILSLGHWSVLAGQWQEAAGRCERLAVSFFGAHCAAIAV